MTESSVTFLGMILMEQLSSLRLEKGGRKGGAVMTQTWPIKLHFTGYDTIFETEA